MANVTPIGTIVDGPIAEGDMAASSVSLPHKGTNGESPPDVKEAKPRGLWCGKKVEVVGVTGEYGCGKTLFLLSIDPVKTRYYDFEKSGGSFADDLGATRVDVPAIMLAMYPGGYTPQQLFEWWIADIKKIKAGEFTVIACDTIGDIEGGLADYVANKLFQEYGFKTPEKFQSMGGVFWASVKAYWKSVLTDLASRCQTFAFASHLKVKYKGGMATSDKTPAGKSTLMELSSLYLWLERKQAEKPTATVIKARLTSAKMVNGKLEAVDILPPRLPEGTYAAICEYIQSPAGARKLKKGEQTEERVLSEDEKLRMRAEIAENERLTAEIVKETVDARPAMAKPKAKPKAEEAPAAAAVAEEAQTEPTAPATPEAEPKPESKPVTKLMTEGLESNGPVTTEQLQRVSQLKKELNLSTEVYKTIVAEYNVETARDLTGAQCDMLIKELIGLMTKSDMDKWAEETLKPNK